MSCSECPHLARKLKVMQADYEFELRKQAEDHSSDKAIYEVNLQKDVRKWQDKYSKEKSMHEEATKKWLAKVDEVTTSAEQSISRKQQECVVRIAEESAKREAELSSLKKNIQEEHQDRLDGLVNKYESEINEKQEAHRSIVGKMTQQHEATLSNTVQFWQKREAKLKNDYESYILGLRSEKNAEERENKRLKDEYREQHTRLITEIYHLKQKKMALEQSIVSLEATVKQRENQIQQQQQRIVSLNQEHQITLEKQNNEFMELLEEKESDFEQKIHQFFENELRITEKYQKSIERIEESREMEQRLYEHNMKEVRQCVENRPSRVEDVEEIQLLRGRLTKMEQEYQLMAREVKACQLELENKEDTFNKIFIPTLNSTHLNANAESNQLKRKELKVKRTVGKSVSSVREILGAMAFNSNSNNGNTNLPALNGQERKLLPPKNTKML